MGKLFWKILLGFWLTLFVLGAGVGVGITLYHEARTQDSSIEQGPRADFLTGSMAWALEHAAPDTVEDLVRAWPNKRDAPPLVVDESGRDIVGRQVPPRALEQAQAQAGSITEAARHATTADGRYLLIFVPAGNRPPHGRMSLPVRDFRMLLAAMAVLASLIFSALLARNLARPIRKLRDAFDGLAAGQLETRVAETVTQRRDELGELGRDFDRMAKQLQQLVSTRRRLLHDISHELRSPLARLQVAVGLARQQPQSIDTSLNRIERESQKLDALVGEVLTVARIEAGTQARRDDYIDLLDLLQTIAEDARFEIAGSERSIRIIDDVEGELIVRGQGDLLHRAFENVIRNAVRHTAVGTEVRVSVTIESASGIVVRVADEGPGVAASELQIIFEPFYRSSSASDAGEMKGSGYGLGLAIARHAIEAHGGSISARNQPQGGLEVVIDLPSSEQGRAVQTG